MSPPHTMMTSRSLSGARLLTGLFLGLSAAALVVIFFLPRRESLLASPLTITLIAVLMSLWFAFSADRDARQRMEVIKTAFEGHGALPRLLKDYLLVYLVVLLRLQTLTLCGILTAVWGNGPMAAAPFPFVALLLTARAWPTQHKLQLLLKRAGIGEKSSTVDS